MRAHRETPTSRRPATLPHYRKAAGEAPSAAPPRPCRSREPSPCWRPGSCCCPLPAGEGAVEVRSGQASSKRAGGGSGHERSGKPKGGAACLHAAAVVLCRPRRRTTRRPLQFPIVHPQPGEPSAFSWVSCSAVRPSLPGISPSVGRRPSCEGLSNGPGCDEGIASSGFGSPAAGNGGRPPSPSSGGNGRSAGIAAGSSVAGDGSQGGKFIGFATASSIGPHQTLSYGQAPIISRL